MRVEGGREGGRLWVMRRERESSGMRKRERERTDGYEKRRERSFDLGDMVMWSITVACKPSKHDWLLLANPINLIG